VPAGAAGAALGGGFSSGGSTRATPASGLGVALLGAALGSGSRREPPHASSPTRSSAEKRDTEPVRAGSGAWQVVERGCDVRVEQLPPRHVERFLMTTIHLQEFGGPELGETPDIR